MIIINISDINVDNDETLYYDKTSKGVKQLAGHIKSSHQNKILYNFKDEFETKQSKKVKYDLI